jgi:hypothetical protein
MNGILLTRNNGWLKKHETTIKNSVDRYMVKGLSVK